MQLSKNFKIKYKNQIFEMNEYYKYVNLFNRRETQIWYYAYADIPWNDEYYFKIRRGDLIDMITSGKIIIIEENKKDDIIISSKEMEVYLL